MEKTQATTATLERPTAPRVMVVDDEPCVRGVFARVLAMEGCDIRVASSALEALAQLEQSPADVVVTDLAMPGLRGELFAEQISQRYPGVRVVVVSGWVVPQSRPALLESGVHAVLHKPLQTLEPLVNAVFDRPARGMAS